jgi:hypothetical protein
MIHQELALRSTSIVGSKPRSHLGTVALKLAGPDHDVVIYAVTEITG